MNFYKLDQGVLQALTRPPMPPSLESTRNDRFPKLETVEFHCPTFSSPHSDLKKGFRDLLASHPVKKMVLRIHFEDKETDASLDEGDE
ncbi:hypothetical protein FRC11_001241, partial [Ceratobasidium sp. 423]